METLFAVLGVLGVSGIISAFANRRICKVEQQQEEQKKRQKAVENGVQALLRSDIIGLYNKYIEKGYMPIYERENLEHLYTEYKALHGNGVVESLIEKLDDLPTTPHH